MSFFKVQKERQDVIIKWLSDIYSCGEKISDHLKNLASSFATLSGEYRNIAGWFDREEKKRVQELEYHLPKELKPIKEVLAKHLADTVSTKSEISNLKMYFDKKLEERDRLYQQLLREYIKLALHREQQFTSTTPIQKQTNELLGMGLFDEVPLSSSEGYKTEDLLIGGYSEHDRQKVKE